MNWHKVLDINEINYPFIKKIKVKTTSICLVGIDNEICALSARCPHAGEDISRGWCTDGKLVCPIHRFSYDIHSGRGSAGQGDYLKTYPVKVKADGVYVGINSRWSFITRLFER